jgi:hypothetical protein
MENVLLDLNESLFNFLVVKLKNILTKEEISSMLDEWFEDTLTVEMIDAETQTPNHNSNKER